MSLVTDEIRASASEFYTGNDICQEKSKFLLTEKGLPNGLLPMQDMLECGYVKDTGFVWLKSKEKTEHKFEKIGRHVQYGTEVTAIVEQNKIKKLTGVKAKELLIWLTLTEICVDDPPTGKIHFKATSGLSRTFPVSAFEIDVPKKEEVNEEVKEEVNEVVNKENKEVIAAAAAAVEVKEVFQGIGFRIEDEVLITESGYEVLTASIPKEIKHLESLLNNFGSGRGTEIRAALS